MNVTLIDHMGSDDLVCDAARVSHNKQASGFTAEQNAKLIKYLATHNHWSPFSHPQVSFRIKAPIFVARQLWKSHVGISGGDCGYMAWNEVSRRYVDDAPEFYTPGEWHARAPSVKQGSSDEVVTSVATELYEAKMAEMQRFYEQLLVDGVAPEEARMVLPQSLYSEWFWTGSLAAFARVCNLRLDGHAQRAAREVAGMIAEHMAALFPVSWRELVG